MASQSNEFKPGLTLAWRFALRELRGGLRGFYVFLACIALGVAAISGVNSVARSITHSISSEGQAILGGDASFSIVQRDLPDKERKFLNDNGKISRLTRTRAMARLPASADQKANQMLIELKAIDEVYPLFGKFEGQKGEVSSTDLKDNLAIADQILLDRLEISIGDSINVGETSFTITDTIKTEPDRIGEGIGFGPKVIVSHAGMAATGLIKPGSLIRYTYNLKLENADPKALDKIIKTAKDDFSATGWRVRSRENAAPALSRNIKRFSQFLTLVGLTSLIVGGVGVANAIRAFLETKRPVIATFKSLGAPGGFIFLVYLLQILVLAMIGVLAGLVLGALAPIGAASALSGLLPISDELVFFPDALGLGAIYGILTAFSFAVWPLGIARDVPAADLFRSTGFNQKFWPRPFYLMMLVVSVAVLVGLAVFLSENRFISVTFITAIGFAFVLLRLVSVLIQWLAKRAPQIKSAEFRMAVGNIHRPGSLTSSVVLSLGLGLALLVALALIDGNLRQQIGNNIPKQAPDFFFVDIQNTEIDGFRSKLSELAPGSKIISVPMLRGRVSELKGIRAEDYDISKGGGWVLRGDRGITYSKRLPENSTLAKGEWWSEDYIGEPLVSFAAEEAGELNLDVGDMISVNVLGRTIKAKIASLRNVEWESLGVNFVLVFSPNTFAGAPHSFLTTLMIDQSSEPVNDGTVLREITKSFPAVTSVRVRDALDTVNRLISQLSTAIRAAASVALLSSILVLGGALAAGNQARIHDAVVFKTLGATRMTLIRTFIYEYAILGSATAIFAVLAGSLASWFVISQIMKFPSVFMPSVAMLTLAVALVFTVGFGLVGTWRILGQKAAPFLREL
ncbi:MAG: glycosyl transferase family 1 [Hyphomicrobiales bacterium]|nr:MAG: glycosyl transferase family 1 [Hyphomicrobiales bacterium]